MKTAKVSPRLRGWSTTSLMDSARLVKIMLRPPTTLAVNQYDNSSNCFNLLMYHFMHRYQFMQASITQQCVCRWRLKAHALARLQTAQDSAGRRGRRPSDIIGGGGAVLVPAAERAPLDPCTVPPRPLRDACPISPSLSSGLCPPHYLPLPPPALADCRTRASATAIAAVVAFVSIVIVVTVIVAISVAVSVAVAVADFS